MPNITRERAEQFMRMMEQRFRRVRSGEPVAKATTRAMAMVARQDRITYQTICDGLSRRTGVLRALKRGDEGPIRNLLGEFSEVRDRLNELPVAVSPDTHSGPILRVALTFGDGSSYGARVELQPISGARQAAQRVVADFVEATLAF